MLSSPLESEPIKCDVHSIFRIDIAFFIVT